MFSFGVDSFIWSETLPTKKVKKAATDTGIRLVTTSTLNKETNIISPDQRIRARGVQSLKTLVDINFELGSPLFAGVIYAGRGCITGKPRTEQEWQWSVQAMRETPHYAKAAARRSGNAEDYQRYQQGGGGHAQGVPRGAS